MDNETSFGTKVGQFIGNIFVACLGICLSAIAIALTVRFILWLI